MSRILVADDNSNIQKMVALALKDEGIDVVAVGNGDAAMRKIPDLRPDLVLADIFMPVRSGYEVCEFVKSDSRYMNTPVVLLVGAFDPLDEDETQRVRADGVLKKPFVPPDPLINMVKALLAKSNGQNSAAVITASTPQPAPEPQAAIAAPAPVKQAPKREARQEPVEQSDKPELSASIQNYAPEGAKLEEPGETDEVTTAVRDPNLGEPFWAVPEEQEQEEEEQKEQSDAQPEEMLDMHSFGKEEGRGETGRFRPDTALFEAALDGAPDKKNKKRATPEVEKAAAPSAESKGVKADEDASKPVERRADEVMPAAAAPEEMTVEPFKFDPTLTFPAAAEMKEEPQELMPLPGLPAAQTEPARTEDNAFSLEPTQLEVPVRKDAAAPLWPTLADPIGETPAAPAIPVEAHPSFEPAEMNLAPLPNQDAVIEAATEAARKAFSELQGFAEVSPAADNAGAAAQETAGHYQDHVEQKAQDGRQDWPAAHTEAPRTTPEMIDAVVNRLLERMQPQIMEVVNREVLRPAIEAIVRREMEKS